MNMNTKVMGMKTTMTAKITKVQNMKMNLQLNASVLHAVESAIKN